MRLLRRLLVFLFVRRKAQVHARSVLDERARKSKKTAKPVADDANAVSMPMRKPVVSATGSPAPVEFVATTAVSANPREQLIHDALAARKRREAEWDALTPEQKNRAIVGLGEGMAAIVKTFRAASI